MKKKSLAAVAVLAASLSIGCALTPHVTFGLGEDHMLLEGKDWSSPDYTLEFAPASFRSGSFTSSLPILFSYTGPSEERGGLRIPFREKLLLGTKLGWRRSIWGISFIILGGLEDYPEERGAITLVRLGLEATCNPLPWLGIAFKGYGDMKAEAAAYGYQLGVMVSGYFL